MMMIKYALCKSRESGDGSFEVPGGCVQCVSRPALSCPCRWPSRSTFVSRH